MSPIQFFCFDLIERLIKMTKYFYFLLKIVKSILTTQ